MNPVLQYNHVEFHGLSMCQAKEVYGRLLVFHIYTSFNWNWDEITEAGQLVHGLLGRSIKKMSQLRYTHHFGNYLAHSWITLVLTRAGLFTMQVI